MPPEQPPKQDKNEALKAIHTFESDAAEVLKKENITKEKIAIAESKRREGEPVVEKPPLFTAKTLNLSTALPSKGGRFVIPWKLIGIISGAIAIVVIGALIYFGILRAREGRTTEEPVVETSTTAKPSQIITISTDDERIAIIEKIQKKVRDSNVSVNGIETLPVRIGSSPATVITLFRELDTRTPASLTRSIGPSFTLGVHGFRGSQPFLVMPVASYDHAFSGMLAWEKDILDDIGPLFGVSKRELSMSTGSSTDEVLSQNLHLKDAIIKNRDARALFGEGGNILFLYSFPDKQTLIITTNEDTFRVLEGKTRAGKLRVPVTQ